MPEPFRFSSGQLAHSAKDLIGVCHQSPQDVIYHLNRGDFENWLAYIGETEIAQKVGEVRQSSVSDEEKLQQFLNILQPPEPEIVTATPEATEPTPITAEPEETTPIPEVTEPTSITAEPQESTPPEVTEPTPITAEPEETTPTPEVTEPTPITAEPQETTPTPEATEPTPITSESIPEVTNTEDKSSTKTTASVTQETEKKDKTKIAPPNEYSEEMPKPNSPFAKAMKDFISRYIGEK